MTREGDDIPDVELVAQLAAGDVNAAERLYDRYASTLLALSLRILRERSDAEDVVHDAFVTMSARASQYAPERGSVVAWLVTLVRNLSIDRTRRRERRGSILRNMVAEEPKALAHDPEGLLSDARVRDQVRRALAAIPDVQRATLEFAFFEGPDLPWRSPRRARRGPAGYDQVARRPRASRRFAEAMEEGQDRPLRLS